MGKVLSKSASGLARAPLKGLDALRFILWYIRLSVPYKYTVWGLYLAVWFLYTWLRSFWWLLRGVSYRRWKNNRGKNYEHSAHVQNIHFRYKMDPVLETSEEHNFITSHHSFQHPQYVLRDNVTLYSASPKGAFFIETDPKIDVAQSDVACFMRVAQFNHARKLIYLPIESFHAVADLIGRPQANITFVNNTTRCGSTVLVQMFEHTGKCRTLSENDALNMISFHERRNPKQTVLQLLESVVRLLCKPYRGMEYQSYLLKTTATGIFFTDLMQEQFPESKILFMYRNGINVADSLSKASIQMPVLRSGYVIFVLCNFGFDYQQKISDYLVNFPNHPRKHLPSIYACCIYTWAAIIRIYLDWRQKGIEVVGVKYEHLVANPKENMEIILEYCGLPKEWAEKSLKALDKDSQRNSPLSKKHLKQLESIADKFDIKKNKMEVDLMCQWTNIDYDAPNDFVAEGTITVPAKLQPNGVVNGHVTKVPSDANGTDLNQNQFMNGIDHSCKGNEKVA